MAEHLLRLATVADVPTILGYVKALAAFEHLSDEVAATEEDFARSLFGPAPRAEALIAEVAGVPAGFALWFYNFSTFEGRHGLYLEDIYIDPAHRGAGLGRAIFHFLARHAVAQGCARMDWEVLNWNSKAVAFYRSLGSVPRDGWTRHRLAGPALHALAEG
ncbi:N-acetyltransferase family protein [Acidisoma sp. C75]